MSSRRDSKDERAVDSCSACPLGEVIERRAFLRDAAVAAVGIFATLGIVSSEARALPIRLTSPLSARADERTYPLPVGDGATIDKEESIITWAWQTHAATRAKLEAARADQGNSHLEFVRLTSPAAVRRFLRSAAPPPTSGAPSSGAPASGVDQL